ncbi:MAG: hypothetical protein MUO67_13605, partial [Anaerolineales bacterium]|nr:hypothetical protein [Anaerolineales bacterium]
ISDRFAVYFVPAGYVFSIWGLIYLGLIAFAIFQALPSQRDNPLLKRISPAFWLANLANSAWIFLWHYEFFPFTLIAMVALLASLLYIYRQISLARSGFERIQKWSLQLPFSIYLGWISVATIANITQVLFYLDWSAWGIDPVVWTIIMIATATTLGLAMLWREHDRAYGLVLIWAFIGIAIKQSYAPLITGTSWVAVGLLSLAGFVYTFRNRSFIGKQRYAHTKD